MTVQEYTQRINKLFEFHNFPISANLSDKEDMTAKLTHAQERKETIARHRSPTGKDICVAMAKLASESDQDSLESITFDKFCLCRVTGFRVIEYTQKLNLKLMSMNSHPGIRSLKPSFLQIGCFTMIKDILCVRSSIMPLTTFIFCEIVLECSI